MGYAKKKKITVKQFMDKIFQQAQEMKEYLKDLETKLFLRGMAKITTRGVYSAK